MATITQPSDEQIRTRAYYLWEADGRPQGRDWDYWMKAQQEFAPHAAATPTPVATAKSGAPAKSTKAEPTASKPRASKRTAVYA